MNIVPFRLIPDKGSIGYKLYQEELKAKAEAAKAAEAAKTKAAATPKTTKTATTSAAKTAEPKKTASEDTKLPKDGGATDFFLNNAKVKYKAAGDRTKVETVHSLSGQVITAEQIRTNVVNPFVPLMKGAFDSIISTLDSYERHVADVEKQQAKIADGDMSYLENLTMSQSMLADSKDHLKKLLSGLKAGMENQGNTKEAEEFFGEYTEFTSGEKLSLQKLFDTLQIA